jgi:hypothetical protein
MSKKAKKPKSPKGGRLPGGSSPRVVLPTYAVDTTTALTSYDSYSGAERISDIVYDINSENFRLWKAQATSDGLGTIDEITGWWVKDELTDDTYVTTNLVTTRSASTYGPGKFYVERMVWDLDPTTTQSLRNGSNVFAVNNLYATGVARAEGRAVSSGEFNDYRTLYASTYLPTDFPAGGDIERTFTTIKGGIVYGRAYSTSKEDESWFRNYGGGKFFGKDWYLNPFGENLL